MATWADGLQDLGPVTLAVLEAPWHEVVSDVCLMLGVACALEPSDITVTAEWVGVDGGVVLRALASRAGVTFAVEDGVLVVREGRAAEQLRVVRLEGDAGRISEALRLAGGQGVEVATIGSSAVVAGDARGMERVAWLIEERARHREAWWVGVTFVRVSRSWLEASGVEWQYGLEGRIAVSTSIGEGVPEPMAGASLGAELGAALRSSDRASVGEVLTMVTLYCLGDGQEVTAQNGDVVPFPKRAITEQGIIADIEYERIPTGVTVTAAVWPIEGGCVLSITPKVSTVTGERGGFPVVAESSVNSRLLLASGEEAVIVGLREDASTRADQRLAGLGGRLGGAVDQADNGTELIVLVQAVRVRGGE